MKALLTAGAAVLLLAAQPSRAHEVPDPSIKRSPHDGVVRLYGAGGPDTAFRKVASVFTAETGVKVEVNAGPEPTWSRQAQANADILWGTSEEEITALLETYSEFRSDDVTPIYIRPAIIAVRAGNPKHIHDFKDLLREDVRVVVTEGAGVANTSGTGVWEDVAGRLGSLEDIRRLRRNIVAYGHGSGASYKAFVDLKADAWITWPDWPITHPGVADYVNLPQSRRIWRDVSVTLAHDADPNAKRFISFLVSDRGAVIMKTEGWVR
jgi:accessory colonization factor AcfC